MPYLKKHRNTLLIILFFCVSLPVLFITEIDKLNCTEPIEAVVVKERKRKISGKRPYYVYDATVIFEIGEISYKGKVTSSSNPIGVGNSVFVYYNPSRPSSIILPDEKERVEQQFQTNGGMVLLILFLIPIVAVFILFGVFTDKKREKRLLEKAKLSEVQE